MTKHVERLECPACDAPLVLYDGLGEVEDVLAAWRQALADHQPRCAASAQTSTPPPTPAPPETNAESRAERSQR